MDAYVQDHTYVLRFDLPGVDPDDVDLTVESGTLTVTAARPRKDTEKEGPSTRKAPTECKNEPAR